LEELKPVALCGLSQGSIGIVVMKKIWKQSSIGQGAYNGSLLFVLPLFLITLLRSWILLISWNPAFIETISWNSGGVGPWSSPPGPF